MDNEIKSWLFDIHSAIIEIDDFFNEGDRIFTNYQKDIKTKRAVVRNLEIIGEATKRLSNLLKKQYPDIPWRNIAGLRGCTYSCLYGS